MVGELVEALLVGEQLRLRLLSLGQVAHEIRHEPAVARLDGHAAHFDVHLPPVLEPLHELDAAARFDARKRRDHGILRIVRTAQHGQHRTPAKLVQREPELLLHGRVRIDDLAGARIGHEQPVLRLFDDRPVTRLEREAVRVEPARTRHEQHGDDGEAADKQAQENRLIERGAGCLREGATRNLQLHEPDGSAHEIAKDQVAAEMIAARRSGQQVRGERRAPHPVANVIGNARAFEVRHGRSRDRPRREAPHAHHHRRRERAREGDPAAGLAGSAAVEDRACRKQGRTAGALHDAAKAVGAAVQLSGRHGLFDPREQIGVGRNLVLLHRGCIERERGTRRKVAIEHEERVDLEAYQRGGVEGARQVVRPPAPRELGRFGRDRVVANGGMEILQFGGEAALQLLALHVDVARLDVGDIDQPASLRPTIENDQNDGDHRADYGQRRSPDSGLGFRLSVASHNVNCVTCIFGPLQSVPGAALPPAANRAHFSAKNSEAPTPFSGAGALGLADLAGQPV